MVNKSNNNFMEEMGEMESDVYTRMEKIKNNKKNNNIDLDKKKRAS